MRRKQVMNETLSNAAILAKLTTIKQDLDRSFVKE
jgi:hypothetical protein